MKLSLNKEYAIRHLGVAALFFGLSLYFLYDAIFVYPYLPADGPHHTTVEFQYTSAALWLRSWLRSACSSTGALRSRGTTSR